MKSRLLLVRQQGRKSLLHFLVLGTSEGTDLSLDAHQALHCVLRILGRGHKPFHPCLCAVLPATVALQKLLHLLASMHHGLLQDLLGGALAIRLLDKRYDGIRIVGLQQSPEASHRVDHQLKLVRGALKLLAHVERHGVDEPANNGLLMRLQHPLLGFHGRAIELHEIQEHAHGLVSVRGLRQRRMHHAEHPVIHELLDLELHRGAIPHEVPRGPAGRKWRHGPRAWGQRP
mmetsp:Transcript_8527/g.18173  ORF Transcript_8527/g.18173 Transcript_8527/m.18173 type:complete len:231 (+) Transcript_8527:1447-2139(+)